ncbi:Kinesin-like protein KIF20A [Trichoplax sp. H2]|nr:Kinesin-like protein KIF20A [Trichoplax sp. H2]|eukprot:RDD42381.1 Kinesin-like protein KIF20A [Trichoplax sp. H2]
MEDTCIVRGNLFEEFETPVKASENPKKEKENTTNKEQTLKVFLRVRPQLEKEQGEEKLTCFQIDDKDQELTAKAPKDSFNFKSAFRGCSELQHKFTFTKIFGPHTGQKDIFNETVLQSVKESANGKNALIFTYGVTNSGKSYTINGSSKDTGILPRAVDVLFNSIGDQLYSKHLVKTLNHSDFILLDDKEQAEEAATKSKLLDLLGLHDHKQSLLTNNSSGSSCENSLADTSKLSNQTTTSAASSLQHEDSCLICSLGREIDQRIIEDTVIEIENLYDYKYAVWVSYAEVYNEQIFDLLAAPSKKKKERRPVLRQKQDHRGNVYVKDLKEVLVTDRQEAYKLFKIGQRNQQIAATKLNQQSSRRLCFVDLAGSERQAKTQALGMHIGEAGKINNSLMTLGKCIEAMRYNQYHRNHPRIVPFRESQLTRWLQNHFAGRGLISMIVNISPCTQVYDETLHVLKFSAIAKQVTTVPKPEIPSLPLMPRISIAWENDTNISIEKEESDSTDTRITGLLELIELLKDALVEKEREIILAEEKARKEVADEFQQQFEKRQAEWEEHTQQLVSLREEKYEKKIEILQKTIKKRKRNASESDVEDEQYSYDSLDTTPTKNGKDSNKIINDLKVQVNNLREVNNKLEEDAAKASVDNDKIYELQIRNEELQKMVTERELKLRAIQWPKTDVSIQASSAEACKEYPEKDAKILDLEYALREKCELVQFLELELDSFKKTTEEAEATAATARENLERLNEQHQQNILSTDPQQQIQELVAYKDENQELMQSVAKLTRNCEMHKMEVQNSQKNEKELEVALSGKNNLIDNLKEQLKHSCQESGKLQQQLLDSEGIVDSLTERSNVLSSKLESTEKKIQFYEEEFVHYRNLLNKNENNTNGVDVVDNTNHIITEVAVTSATSDQPVQCNFFDEIDQRVQSLEEDNALLQETVSKKCGEVVFLEDALKELRRVHEDFIGNEKSLKDKLNGCSDLQAQIDALQNQLSQLEESEQRKSTKLISMEDELKEARQALNQYKEQLEKTLQATDEERLTVSNEIDSLKAANELLREESDSNQQELQSVIDSKSQKIAELNDQVHNVTKEKRELSDENLSLLQQLSDLKIQISDLNTKNEAKSEMLGNLQKDLTNKVDELNRVKDQFDSCSEQLCDTKQDLTNKVDELNRVKDQFGSCSEQLCDTKKDLTNKVDELNRVKDQFGSCSEQLCDTEKNLNEAKVNFEELTADNSDKARCISDLKEQLAETKRKFTEASEASDELENLRRKYNVALSDLEAANIAVTEVQEQLVILTNRNNESEAKVDELTNKISSMNEEEEKLIKAHAEIAAMTKTIAADKEVIDKIKNDNEQLLNRIETMSTDIATIKERNDELTIIATKYRENYSNDEKKQDQINDLIKENTKLIDNIREMENEMKSLSERILSADINDESLTKTNKELQEIRNKYSNLEEEHKDLLGRHMRTIQLAKDKDDKLEAVKSEEIAQRQHLRNQLSELRKKLDKSEETLDKTVEKAKIAEERVVEVHEEVSVLRNKYDSILKQLDEKNNEIQGYLTNNTDCEKKYLQQIAELNQSREEMMAAAKSSEIAFNKISEELDSVSKKNSNLYKERKDLEANLQDLNRKIKISVDEKSTLKQQNGELIECKKTLEEQIQKLENRLASDERHADEIKLQQVQKESRVQEVQQELYDAKQKIKSLESQVKSMQSDITASSCALKMERESKSEIESKVRVFEGKQQQSFDNENELKKKLRDVEKIKVNVDSKCESLQRQISEISLQNDNLQKTNEALKAEIVRLSEDVEIANQALDEAQENEQKMIEWRKEKDDIVGQFRCALNKIKGEKEELEKEKSEMLTTLGQLKNNMANSEDQINDLLESKEKMQEEKNKLCEKVEKLSADLKHMHQRSEHSKKSSIKHEDEQQDETLIRASTPQVLLAENRDKVHTPKASEVVPKTANISKIAETTRASVEESITIAETSKLSNVQTTREKKSVAATSKRTRRKRISSNVEESEENSSPPKSLKLDNPSTPVAGRSMRTAKVKAIANLAQIEDPSPSRIPLSLKGEENCSTSKKSSTGKRGIHKVMNNFLQNSPLRRSSKKKTKEEHAIVENSTDRHIPPAKPKRKLYKVQDLNEFTAAMDELSHKETDKTAEVITRQLRPRRR